MSGHRRETRHTFIGVPPVIQAKLAEQRALAMGATGPAAIQAAAQAGTRGVGGPLPYLERIQEAFGQHDVSGVQAHVGGPSQEACQAIGARAYASGNQVAFREAPDLHTAAHEAAHVVQQRAGVSLAGGVGQAGDRYEQHADQVADAVVQGKSAEGILHDGDHAGSRGPVQREEEPGSEPLGTQTRVKVNGTQFETFDMAAHQTVELWNDIRGSQLGGLKDWYKAAKIVDPPPLSEQLLKASISIAVGAATAGIGSWITEALEGKAGQHLLAAAIAAGQGIVGKAVDEAFAGASSAATGLEGVDNYESLTDTAIQKVTGEERAKTGGQIESLKALEEPERSAELQGVADTLSEANAKAKLEQQRACLQGWLTLLAQQAHGTEKHGGKDSKHRKDPSTNQDELNEAGPEDAVGTIVLHLEPSDDPTKGVVVERAVVEESEGVNEKILTALLNIGKPVGDLKIPKMVTGFMELEQEGVIDGEQDATVTMSWDEQGQWSAKGLSELGRAWVAAYGKDSKHQLSKRETDMWFLKGVRQIELDVLHSKFTDLGLGEIEKG